MDRTVYALLVGIDNYPSPVPPLNGCRNDIAAIETLLKERIAGGGYRLEALVLKDKDATRQAIIDGFLKHLSQAGSNDVALFYYSGHGSQERTPPEFWHLEPDRLDETLVCYDSRSPNNYDLADKELSKLIAEVARRDPHIVVILDSCHSGSGTRNIVEGVRRVPTDLRERPLKSFIVTPAEAAEFAAKNIATETESQWVRLPRGKHLVISACRDDEEAKETSLDGSKRGVFSYFLTETLQRSDASLTYRDLFKRVNALVRTKAARQSPLIEATDIKDLDRPFLGGAIRAHPQYFAVSFDPIDGWVLDGGAVHGIPPVEGDETTQLVLFPFESKLDQVHDLKSAIGEARVTQRLPARSKIEIQLRNGQAPDPQLTYKAVITALPLPVLGVCIEGHKEGADLVRAALGKAGPNNQPSLLVREIGEGAEMRLIVRKDGYRIMRAADDQPLVVDLLGVDQESATQAVQRLEHIARWLRIAELANPTSKLSRDAVHMEIYQMPDPDAKSARPKLLDVAKQGSELRLEYKYRNDKWEAPQFKVKLTNTGKQPLYCVLLDLTETYGVSSELLPGGGIWLKPQEEAWANSGEAIHAEVPNELWEKGLAEIKDLLKLIASTEECDATLLDQDELDVRMDVSKRSATRGVAAPKSTLERLMNRVQTRKLSAKPQGVERLADWVTAEVSITTLRPLKSVPVPDAEKATALTPVITLVGHPKFKAQVRLSTLPTASRDLGLPALPNWLRDDPSLVRPLQFSESRSGDPGASVLELTHVDEASVASVTPQQPLVIRLDQGLLHENEHVLPVSFDPKDQLFLPLGFAHRNQGAVDVSLIRLPSPVVDSRSLTGSIRIFFEKVITERLGLTFKYPLLAVAESEGCGKVNYLTTADQVQARVKAAQRIVLYIHGIIGDTRSLAASARVPGLAVTPPVEKLADLYDLILTFDYENLNTKIEDNARLLKKRLEEVGLGEGHGKTVHIVAHSMGGLVSRWFIEREGGNKVVQRLVMLGTPNGGSPWPTIEDWLTTLIGMGLNGLSSVPWPSAILSRLMSAAEKVVSSVDKVTIALGQMDPKSEFLKELASGPDPRIPYTIIAGNTSLIAVPGGGEQVSRWKKLLQRLAPQRLLHEATSLAFFGEPNDIAVSVESIKRVLPASRQPEPTAREVACDHVTYFSTEAGLRALAEAVHGFHDSNKGGA